MIWLTDRNGQTTYMGPEWYALSGRQVSETLGRTWTMAIHPDERALICEAIAQACILQCQYVIQYRLRQADGTYVWVIDSAAPSHLPGSGEFLGFLGMIGRSATQQPNLIARIELRSFHTVPALGDLAPQSKLDMIANHVLTARSTAMDAATELLPAIDLLLFAVGQAIAHRINEADCSDSIH